MLFITSEMFSGGIFPYMAHCKTKIYILSSQQKILFRLTELKQDQCNWLLKIKKEGINVDLMVGAFLSEYDVQNS